MRQVCTSPEADLVCACARTGKGPEVRERVNRLLVTDLNWEEVVERATRNGVLPLLYHHLSDTNPEAVPAAVLDKLRDIFHFHARRNLMVVRELIQVLRLLEGAKIPAISFKGPLLAASIYRNVALRTFYDLDILIKEEHVLQTIRLLADQGYSLQEEFSEEGKAARLLASKKDFKLINKEKGIAIELHWRLVGKKFRFPFDMNLLWETLEKTRLGGTEVMNFPPEDLLLILCVHGSKHLWGYLLWITDVAELIRAYPALDWQGLFEKARRLGCERMVRLGLFVAHDLLQVELPAEILSRVRSDRVVEKLGAQVRAEIYGEGTTFQNGGLYLFHIRMRERFGDRLWLGLDYGPKYLSTILKPSSADEEFFALSKPFRFFYFFLRPLRVAMEYGSSWWRKLVKRKA